MKKILFGLLTMFLITLIALHPQNKSLYAAEVDGFVYEVNGDTVTITGYTGSDMDVNVPQTIEGKPVVAIGKQAFGNKLMNYVTLPETVRTIGDYAFANSINLIGVYFPSRLDSLGQGAFSGCSQLGFTSSSSFPIVLPPGLTEIKSNTFSMCANLLSVTLPEGITKIGPSAFLYCSRLMGFNLPASVVRIESQAFLNATDMPMPTFGPDINYIGREAFYNTRWFSNYSGEWLIVGQGQLVRYGGSATSLTLPDTVRRICSHAFSGKSSLKSVYLSDQITEIDYFAFGYCNLQTIRIPPSVITIENQAFQGNNGLIIQGYRDTAAQVFAEAHKQYDNFSFSELVLVQFNSLGGNSMPAQEVTAGSHLGEPAPPTRSGHVFLGWFTGLDFSTQWNFAASAADYSSTLYANWRLPVPAGLQVSRPQATSANLAWNAQTGANGYEVYRASSMGGSYALIKTLAGTSMTDSGLSAYTSYYYKIRSFSTTGEIKFYSEMSQSVLAPMITPGVTVTPVPTVESTTVPMATSEASSTTAPTGQVTPTASATSTSLETNLQPSVSDMTSAPEISATPLPSATEPKDYPAEPVPWFYFVAGFVIAGLLATVIVLIKLKK